MSEEPEKKMEDAIREDGRYPLEAYAFLHEGLSRAVREVYGEESADAPHRHVTGAELCHGLRRLAIEKWGMLARTVLGKWNIHATIDFGNMVYLMIAHKYMKKTDEDSVEDFRDVYDFSSFDRVDNIEMKE